MTVFLGSSREARDELGLNGLAESLKKHVGKECGECVRPWWLVFGAGNTSIDILKKETQKADLAVFVLRCDDVIHYADKQWYSTRQNVVYELGLFAGALGLEASLMLVDDRGVNEQVAREADLHIASDLDGVTQIRITDVCPGEKDRKQGEELKSESFDLLAQKIARAARNRFDDLGLGWWIIESANLVPEMPRSMFGVFEMVATGQQPRVQHGEMWYGQGFEPLGMLGQLREFWDSRHVELSRGPKERQELFLLVDVNGLPNVHDPLKPVHQAGSFKTVYRAFEKDEQGWFYGRFFNIENLDYKGTLRLKRLGNVSADYAEHVSKREFAPGLLLQDSPHLKERFVDDAEDDFTERFLRRTVVRAKCDVGWGYHLFIRGSTPPLTWSKGTEMRWTEGNIWTWETDAFSPSVEIEFKVVVND